MPRKIREYKVELDELGFREIRRDRGSHRVWKHGKLRNGIVIAFKPYLVLLILHFDSFLLDYQC